ncbi:hypothetical protein HMPREF9072_02441 [Capnocytophaga sp. oral taxon 324 str. F0483]|nr:hypothetical protein HMPREF9072_02441 [Capnocytophaga sp. oral taxon 324 str. F0483]
MFFIYLNHLFTSVLLRFVTLKITSFSHLLTTHFQTLIYPSYTNRPRFV